MKQGRTRAAEAAVRANETHAEGRRHRRRRPVELDHGAVREAMAHAQALRAEPARGAPQRPGRCPEAPPELVRIEPATVRSSPPAALATRDARTVARSPTRRIRRILRAAARRAKTKVTARDREIPRASLRKTRSQAAGNPSRTPSALTIPPPR